MTPPPSLRAVERGEAMSSAPVVVTGAGGFVGANLCRFLLERGERVVGVLGTATERWRMPEHPALELVQLDLRQRDGVQDFLERYRPEVVVNCAAYGAYSSQTDADRIYAVNVDSVRYLLEGLQRQGNLRAFVQTGSSSEYGLNCSGPSEDTELLPDSHYAVSKVAASALVRLYGTKHGLPAWNLRLYSVYGPYEDTSRLIPRLLLHAREGRLPPLVNPSISRDFVHVDDVCRAVLAVVQRAARLPRGESFNVGTGKRTTLRGLVSTVRKSFRVRVEPVWGSMPDRAWDNPNWFANPAKARRLLKWQAELSLEQGLRSTMGWVEAHAGLIAQAEAASVVRSTR
jgi:nucleoside-diphosphate-sugar epimerase